MTIFGLLEYETERHITLRVDFEGAKRQFGNVVVTYVLNSVSPSETRLIVNGQCEMRAVVIRDDGDTGRGSL
jgi:hypothetical protein